MLERVGYIVREEAKRWYAGIPGGLGRCGKCADFGLFSLSGELLSTV
jgi:hypothetical protein